MTIYQKADLRDAKSIRQFIDNRADWHPTIWEHAPRQPTFAAAVILATVNDLTAFEDAEATINQSKDRIYRAFVQVSDGTSSRCGAGSHADATIAKGFAYRNAVRQMILNDEGEKQT